MENLPAAPRRHTATLHEHLRVKLHKTKRELVELPAIDIANTFEWLRIAPPLRRWLRCIEIRKPHVWESVRWPICVHVGAVLLRSSGMFELLLAHIARMPPDIDVVHVGAH